MSCQDRESIVTVLQALAGINRPRLLLRTARHGLRDYQRSTDLRRILRVPATPPPGAGIVCDLIELEEMHNQLRIRPPHEAGSPWRAARHIEVLIALIAEAQTMAQVVAPPD